MSKSRSRSTSNRPAPLQAQGATNTVNQVAPDPRNIIAVERPQITFLHFSDETQVFVNGACVRKLSPEHGHHVQRVVEAIEATSAITIREERMLSLTAAF